MVVIHVQIRRNFIENVFLDSGGGVNIITEKIWVHLGLSKPKPTPYNLCMVYQTIVNPLSMIKYLKFFVHAIPYTFTFTYSNAFDYSYSMLLGCPLFRDAKVSHD